VQLVKAALPSGELEFDGQTRHVEITEDPTAVEYVPAAQSEQVAVPVNALYCPATHAAHGSPFGPVDPALQVQFAKAALPEGELEFDGQTLHVKLAEASTAVEYVPATQSKQVAVPVNTLYFPPTHAEQVPPSGPENPASQVQLVKYKLPTGELEFDGQSMHVVVPFNALYCPATHAAHGPPFGPVDPALQVQLVKAALPEGELEFDGQTKHVEIAEDPTAVEYVPAAQSEQVAVPVNALYCPATHAAHGPPFGPVKPALQRQSVLVVLDCFDRDWSGQTTLSVLLPLQK
jgi:hypothetical protein